MPKKEQEENGMNSFVTWVGGKKLLRNKILDQFPPEGCKKYVECFGGAGWVLFAKEKHAETEVFNDANGELINLFRCVKYHPEALQKELEWALMSREIFLECREQAKTGFIGMTDLQRAARFYLLIKESYGATLHSFGVSAKDMKKGIEYLGKISERLKKVVIENQDFERLIKTYDRKDTLFYLDPPYYGTEKYYTEQFSEEDHKRLRDVLGNIQGKFILSYNNCQQIKTLYEGYEIIEVDRPNTLRAKNGTEEYQELIIKNY